MDFSARNIEFVLACYAITAVLLVVMTATIVLRAKKHDRELARLEQARIKAKR
ncbi:hypothetical protein MNBD_ALPHA08-2129 [hydrothermal vent metagenome]|uniref:Heme exporter protein D n=1 Tax=hydrothermal vent metagenome TaxID=652676 RepID=A0A3B0RBX6_9ZZZZ